MNDDNKLGLRKWLGEISSPNIALKQFLALTTVVEREEDD